MALAITIPSVSQIVADIKQKIQHLEQVAVQRAEDVAKRLEQIAAHNAAIDTLRDEIAKAKDLGEKLAALL